MNVALLVFALEIPSLSYRRGDIVSVSLSHNEPCSHARFVILTVTGIPSEKLEHKFLGDLKETLEEQPALSDEELDPRKKRYWFVDFDEMSESNIEELAQTRSLSLNWGQSKKVLAKKNGAVIGEDKRFINEGDL